MMFLWGLILILHLNIPKEVFAMTSCTPTAPFIRFFKIKSCFKSTMPIISWKNYKDVKECMKFAREKNGLAFNFSPPELNTTIDNKIYRNCQIMGCPETANTSSLVFDPLFDYYSAYGNFNLTDNSICIKSIGLFGLFQEKKNYTDAAASCQSKGADLANILTESRTNSLGVLLQSMGAWYKAAYVGLEDMTTEGVFETPLGLTLECTNFRAWSVGHPRAHRKHEDCVILDVEKVWRAINCKIKLGYICEFYTTPPVNTTVEYKYKNCTMINNKNKKKACLANNDMFDLFSSSPRLDQCALLNDIE